MKTENGREQELAGKATTDKMTAIKECFGEMVIGEFL